MTARDFFFDGRGILRAPWRLGGFVAVSGAALAVLQTLVVSLAGDDNSSAARALALSQVALCAALLLGHFVSLRVIERRPWSMVGLGREAARPRTLLTGAVLSALAIGVPSLALMAIGWLRLSPAANGSSLATAWWLALFLAPAAFAEELLVRGYPFAVLREVWGAPATLLATSLVFGLLHLWNIGVSVQSIVVVSLAGVFLGAVLLATGSLYAAWTAHLVWNWVLAAALHAPVSGFPFAVPDYRVVDAGPDWATGGKWGPEGGAGAVIGMLGGLFYLYARRPRRREP